MPLIQEDDRAELRERLAVLEAPVRLVVFTDPAGCDYCEPTRQLVEEIAGLSDKLEVEIVDRTDAPERAAEYGVDKVPAIAVLAGGGPTADTGIRFFGIPAGYEFISLVDAILAVSSGDPGLAPATKTWLAALDRPIHLQVFVTPTCPYCPRAVTLAHRLALASPLVRADMVEAGEFPQLAERYDVFGVPRTVINETVAVEGAVPEGQLLRQLQRAAA